MVAGLNPTAEDGCELASAMPAMKSALAARAVGYGLFSECGIGLKAAVVTCGLHVVSRQFPLIEHRRLMALVERTNPDIGP